MLLAADWLQSLNPLCVFSGSDRHNSFVYEHFKSCQSITDEKKKNYIRAERLMLLKNEYELINTRFYCTNETVNRIFDQKESLKSNISNQYFIKVLIRTVPLRQFVQTHRLYSLSQHLSEHVCVCV